MLVGRHTLPGKSVVALMATRLGLFCAGPDRVAPLQDWARAICSTAGQEAVEPRLRGPIERALFRRAEAILGNRLLGSGRFCRGLLV